MVHHLEKWGAKKYKKGPEAGSSKTKTRSSSTVNEDAMDLDMEEDPVIESVEGIQEVNLPIRQPIMPVSSSLYGSLDSAGAFAHPSPQLSQGPANFSANWLYQHTYGTDNAHEEGQLLGEALFALGYFYAFEECKKRCPMSDDSQMSEVAPAMNHTQRQTLEHNLIICLRSALNKAQAIDARAILQRYVDSVLGESGDESDLATIVDLLAARTFDYGGDKKNAKGQIETKIQTIALETDTGVSFQQLSSRSVLLLLDIPLFLVLSYALTRWNDVDDREERWKSHGHKKRTEDVMAQGIETTEILDQWIDAQLAKNNIQDIPCLSSCIDFCLYALGKTGDGTYVPPIDFSPDQLVSTQVKDIYGVALYLLTAWNRISADPDHHRPVDLTWASTSKSQLGASAAELLITVACIILAESTISGDALSTNTIAKAHRGAELLKRLGFREQLNIFLRQIRKNSDKRMLALRDELDPETLPVFHSVLNHVCNTLDVEPPFKETRFLPLELITESERQCVTTRSGPRRSPRGAGKSTATPSRASSVATNRTLVAQYGEMSGLESRLRGR